MHNNYEPSQAHYSMAILQAEKNQHGDGEPGRLEKTIAETRVPQNDGPKGNEKVIPCGMWAPVAALALVVCYTWITREDPEAKEEPEDKG